jgi:hypothetical protein
MVSHNGLTRAERFAGPRHEPGINGHIARRGVSRASYSAWVARKWAATSGATIGLKFDYSKEACGNAPRKSVFKTWPLPATGQSVLVVWGIAYLP